MLWKAHGFKFLIIISYSWLAKAHPDPDRFHLKRLVRVLAGFKEFHRPSWELGIIIDFCSLWQRGGETETRNEQQLSSFGKCIREINTPYGHQQVTAVKLIAVPESEVRRYEDRGWTLFESVVIDAKEATGQKGMWGFNRLTFDDNLDLNKFIPGRNLSEKQATDFMRKFSRVKRRPPLVPERFAEEMETRRRIADQRDVKLFTSGSDLQFVLSKYQDAFAELAKAKYFTYTWSDWTDEDFADFCKVLPHCHELEQIVLTSNRITRVDPLLDLLFAKAIPAAKGKDFTLWLDKNCISEEDTERLRKVWFDNCTNLFGLCM